MKYEFSINQLTPFFLFFCILNQKENLKHEILKIVFLHWKYMNLFFKSIKKLNYDIMMICFYSEIDLFGHLNKYELNQKIIIKKYHRGK